MGGEKSYDKGYADGRRSSRNKTNIIDELLWKNPNHNPDGSESYEEGFKKGEEDGQKSKK